MDWKSIARAKKLLAEEEGTIYKDWGGKLAIALIYPNTYYVGMSSLGLQSLYRLFNFSEDTVCERFFYEGQAVISLESQRPLEDFTLLAFTLSYEMDYFNLVDILHRAGIPLLASERDESHPLIIAGGPAITANPEPLVPLIDAIAIGEGEVIVPPLIEALKETVSSGKEKALESLSRIPGLYVPILHSPSSIPHSPIPRQWVRDLDAHPTATVVLTKDTEFRDMYLIEISRGCGRGCRFCLAGRAYQPVRERSPEAILSWAKEGLHHRERIGLVSAAVSDYSRIEELVERLRGMGAKVAVSSVRIDSLSESLVRALAESGTKTLTLAPEAGSESLRRAINKRISEGEIIHAAELAAQHKIPYLKLYFMLGLPGESEEDVRAIVELVREIKRHFPGQITVNVAPFVPKAHTAFERAAMARQEVLESRLRYLRRGLKSQEKVALRGESPAWARVQGVLSRGDRRVGLAIVKWAEMKGRSLSTWRRAMRESGLEEEDYLGERAPDEVLPWKEAVRF